MGLLKELSIKNLEYKKQNELINDGVNKEINEKIKLVEDNKILENNLNKIKEELIINNEIQDQLKNLQKENNELLKELSIKDLEYKKQNEFISVDLSNEINEKIKLVESNKILE